MNDFMVVGMALINATCRPQNRPDAVDTSVNCHSIRTWKAKQHDDMGIDHGLFLMHGFDLKQNKKS